ncbi:MAG: DUF2249 domain-containing protein [Ignavibacteria bacterium]|nr:DUF2249 domain-containing protein [Ignavibacteria bacterium]
MITKEMKISEILKLYPETLQIFLKMSPHFKKLENKILRKALAGRVNVEQAAKIAGVDPNHLLFELNKAINSQIQEEIISDNNLDNTLNLENQKSEFLINILEEKIIELDVRPILDSGIDPFNDIMKKVKNLKDDEVLLIINSFEPVPLYSVLGRKGFDHFTKKEGDTFKIYFFKKQISDDNLKIFKEPNEEIDINDFEKVIELNVRDLPPPEPMMKILEALSQIDEKSVLLVHHHREPVMLYPKLEERGYEAITYQVDENYYKVLIMKKRN